MRQLYNSSGQILANTRYDPYGTVLSQDGAATSIYGFTGEQFDAGTGLEYLRARFYDPLQGRFVSKDIWERSSSGATSGNRYNYAFGDPVNLTDPAGLDPAVPGVASFVECFDLHSFSHGVWGGRGPSNSPSFVTAQEAVDVCRAAYRQQDWDSAAWSFDLSTTHLPQTAHNLMGWFVFNKRLDGTGDSDRLFFDAKEPLTRELMRSSLVADVRIKYYREGATSDPTEFKFGYPEAIGTFIFDNLTKTSEANPLSVAIPVFMGSFWYQTVSLEGGGRVGIRIDNDTTLESGSHIAGRYRSDNYRQTVEDLIDNDPTHTLGNKPLLELIEDKETYHLVSILHSRKKGDPVGALGGGDLYQTFTWTERKALCGPALPASWDVLFDLYFDPQVWGDFQEHTKDPEGWPAS